MKKKRIAINVAGGNGWVGGLYYRMNILFSLLQNKRITDKYDMIVMTSKDNYEMIKRFFPDINIIIVETSTLLGKAKFLLDLKKNHCSILYACDKEIVKLLGIIPVEWIADFQHKYYQHFFQKQEICRRDVEFTNKAKSQAPLILSSREALNDFLKFYHVPSSKKLYVVPFVSYIEPILNRLSPYRIERILEHYGLLNCKYICVMNQFWQHKNHIVVLEAMREYFKNNPKSKLKFVFTGRLKDDRSPEYIEQLKSIFENSMIKEHSLLLGFIDREEQIAIMKNSEYIIQPSLFEGWGTVVEDAKVLDKTILLSDIPVHHEQMNDKCILFAPHDPIALAKLIEKESLKEHLDDVNKGIEDMYRRAEKYSKGFEDLLNDLERK